MVAILVLNWNGWRDTIECIKSLLTSSNQDYFIFVGDNGSTNESLEYIEEYCKNDDIEYSRVEYGIDNLPQIPTKVVLCDLKENNGFSKGNNMMLNLASKYSPDYYLLLNNDTEVEHDFLDKLLLFKKNHRDFKILTPLIFYHGDKEKIWNAGGKLKFGFRKYFYADSSGVNFKKGDFLRCTFITGCALFITPDVLTKDNKVFTERFFFGEEDFEFSMRQNSSGNKMACVCDSVIYHKVSASSAKSPSINKVFIYYLNRFINMKMTLSKFLYAIWRLIYFPYVFLIIAKNYSIPKSINFIGKLSLEAKRLISVDKEYFTSVMSSKELF